MYCIGKRLKSKRVNEDNHRDRTANSESQQTQNCYSCRPHSEDFGFLGDGNSAGDLLSYADGGVVVAGTNQRTTSKSRRNRLHTEKLLRGRKIWCQGNNASFTMSSWLVKPVGLTMARY